jgi:GT2 family glycosyltransferase
VGTGTEPQISVIIPVLELKRSRNRDARHLMFGRYSIQEVLHDLDQNVYFPIEVIVVCNGSAKELRQVVQEHPRIDKYILNSTNVGVSRGWNMGAMMAEGEVLCFLNDDVSVGPGVLESLYKALKSDASIGEVGPKGALWRGADHESYVNSPTLEDADVISGFMFMLHADLFLTIGGADVRYTPAGFEEIDLSFAIRQRGLRCVVVPGLDVKHYGVHHGVSASTVPIHYFDKSIDPRDLHKRNRDYFVRKWKIGGETLADR